MKIAAPPPHGVLSLASDSETGFPHNLTGVTMRGRYRIDGVLHVGANAVVARATHLLRGRVVALKIVAPDCPPDARRKFERAASMASELAHEQFPAVLDVGETEDGLPFAVFDFLDGCTFAELQGPLEPTRAVRLVVQLLQGLCYLHGKGITHTNICPKNLFLTKSADETERVKILDLASAVMGSGRPVTLSDLLSGTPGYTAPEQIAGTEFDRRADLYAAGVVFYELLTGRSPWSTRDADAVLQLQATQALPGLPGALSMFDPVVQRLASREQTDRFPSAAAALEALENCVLGRGAPTADAEDPAPSSGVDSDAGPNRRARRRAWVLGAAAVAVALLIGGLWARSGTMQPPPSSVRAASAAPVQPEPLPERVVQAPVVTPAPQTVETPPSPPAPEQPRDPEPGAAVGTVAVAPAASRPSSKRQRQPKPRPKARPGPKPTKPPPAAVEDPSETDGAPPTEQPDPKPERPPEELLTPDPRESPLMAPGSSRGPSDDALLRR